MDIPPEDLLVEVMPPHYQGGQHAGIPPRAIKITHVPSGLVAICESERSQHRCRQVALDMIMGGLTSPAYQGR